MGYVELPKAQKSDYITNKQTNMLLLVLIYFKSAHLIITEIIVLLFESHGLFNGPNNTVV